MIVMHKAVYAVGGLVLGLGAGLFAGRKWALMHYEQAYEDALNQEIAETKAHLNEMLKKNTDLSVYSAVEEVRDVTVEDLDKVVTGLRYGTSVQPKPALPATPIKKNIFLDRDNDDEEDYTEEDAHRDSSKPYIISVDEYMAGDLNYTQVSLTYFAEDDTLIDEAEHTLEDVDAMVGESNLDQFGRRSKDPRMVYIRNDITETDYEIVRQDGSYAASMHGVVAHSADTRRMRR